MKYLVHWKDFSRPHNTWVNVEELNCPVRLAEFNACEQAKYDERLNQIDVELMTSSTEYRESKKIIAKAFTIHRSTVNREVKEIVDKEVDGLKNFVNESILNISAQPLPSTSSSQVPTLLNISTQPLPSASSSQVPTEPVEISKKLRKRTVVCQLCGKILGRRDALTVHMKRIHGNKRVQKCGKYKSNKRYACYLCRGTFTRTSSVSDHMRRFHLPKGPQQQILCICGKFFNSKNSMIKHKKMKKCDDQNSIIER